MIPYEQLLEEQKNIIKQISHSEDSNLFVDGPPGSGKTLISLHTLKTIISKSTIKPLLLIYNNSLFGFLKNNINDLGITDNITIATKDKFFFDEASKNNINGNDNLSYADKYNLVLENLSKIDIKKNYDIVLVDEVQDFNELEWVIVNKIAKKIISLGDFNQNVYESGLNIKSIKDNCKYFELSKIKRFHKNIAEIAQQFSKNKDNLVNKVDLDQNTEPKFYDIDAKDEMKKILEIINEITQNKKTTGIISPSRDKLKELSNFLHENNVKHFHFQETKDLKKHNFNDIAPLLITSFSAKGLEFENVILFGFDNGFQIDKLKIQNILNNVIYVSITRANTNLFFIRTEFTIEEIKTISFQPKVVSIDEPSIDDLF